MCIRHNASYLIPLLALAVLVACGGVSSGTPVASLVVTVPASATRSTPVPTATDAATFHIPEQTTRAIPATSSASSAAVSAAPSAVGATMPPAARPQMQEYAVPAGSGPHDVAPAPDGAVWYTGQRSGELGRLDPATGAVIRVPLGEGSAPHGVIIGPDGAPWVTDGGLNAIVRVDPATLAVRRFPLPANRPNANLNTATFDAQGTLWFTGQNGIYGRLDPRSGEMAVFDAPRGPGPYGITTTPDGAVYYASLAGNYLGRIDPRTGAVTVLDPPTKDQGARRVWTDAQGRLWVSEWTAGQLGRYDPTAGQWKEWKLPGSSPPLAYAVYVDTQGLVWLTDFGNNAIVRFNPARETFDAYPLPTPQAYVRQLLGRPGEVWGAESGGDKLVVIRSR